MKRASVVVAALLVLLMFADRTSADIVEPRAETTPSAIHVTLVRVGGGEQVQSVSGSSSESSDCEWSSVRASTQLDAGIVVPEGSAGGEAVLYNLFCNGEYRTSVWVSPEDIVDVDAAIEAEAERYVQDVLAPLVRIGVNPNGRGLVGLPSWFWIEGFTGSVQAPPISAFGMTVDVRMSSGTVMWDFDDGTVEAGDLGRAYPEESSVQHIHQRHGTYDVTAQIELVPEYSVNGGPWLTLPNLSVTATTSHSVEQRQPVLVNR